MAGDHPPGRPPAGDRVIPGGRALCLQCGRSGAIVWESLDPRHPMMLCQWERKGITHGHGITLGTLDQAESDDIQVRLREGRLARVHARGGHEKRPNHLCVLCELEKPHRGHLRARYSDPSCQRCQAAKAAAERSNPGTDASASPAGAVAVQEGR